MSRPITQYLENNIIGCYSIFVVSSIVISNAHDNVFYENNFANSQYGVYIDGYGALPSENNKFFSNNFLNISKPVQINNNNSVNNWDNGSIGNYWSDYFTKYPQAKEIGNTAIADTPYILNANNTDNFPLINQVYIEFSTSLPSPISPPLLITSDELTPNPSTTESPSPDGNNSINPTLSPTSLSGSYPTTSPTNSPNALITFDFLSNNLFLTAVFSIIALVALILTFTIYKKE